MSAAEFDAEIAAADAERAQMIASVREFYGDDAADLVANGWTVDSALNHVQGMCDITLCTHPAHEEDANAAEVLARVTGSVGARVTYETRRADGSLVVERVESWGDVR